MQKKPLEEPIVDWEDKRLDSFLHSNCCHAHHRVSLLGTDLATGKDILWFTCTKCHKETLGPILNAEITMFGNSICCDAPFEIALMSERQEVYVFCLSCFLKVNIELAPEFVRLFFKEQEEAMLGIRDLPKSKQQKDKEAFS